MLDRRPDKRDSHAALCLYCDTADINLVQRMRWLCVGLNRRTNHYLFRRDDGEVMLLTAGGKRICQDAALCEAAAVLCETLRHGCVEDVLLPRVKP